MATTKKSEAKINGSNYKRSKKHVQKKKNLSSGASTGVINMEGFSLSKKPWIFWITLALVN